MQKKVRLDFELDHVFILVSEGAPEADLLVAFGILEGSSNVHPGQGTANRRFFFHNVMLELAWVSHPDEAQSTLTRPTGLWDHWKYRGQTASPFGIILRPATGQPHEKYPFKGWHYKPRYLPAHLSFWVGDNADKLEEPLLFYFTFGGHPNARKPSQPLHHPTGFREVTSLNIQLPGLTQASDTLKSLMNIKDITFTAGNQHVMEIGFDGEKSGKSKDFQPHLPLVFKW